MTGARPAPRPAPPDGTADTGSIGAAVVVLATTLVACAGLALDGGRVLAARREAAGLAAAAARAAAQEADVRGERPVLDPARAAPAARALLDGTRASSVAVAVVDGDRVTVTVTVEQSPVLLGLAGVGPVTVRATREARLVVSTEGAP